MSATSARLEMLPAQVGLEAPEHVVAGLAALGRTEDVRLSRSGKRLAVACYNRHEVAIADVDLTRTDEGVGIAISELTFHGSASISDPHGIDFLDDELLAVASRGGTIDVLLLPSSGAESRAAASVASVECDLGAAGSVVARRAPGGERELLAVHNWTNAVTRYRMTDGGDLVGGDVIARRWLELPDGIALSADGRWLAISNHDTHDVLVFEYATVHAEADPVGILRGAGYPHGLRFALDDRLLVVADAGAPYVYLFERHGDSWATASYPTAALRVMDDETFARGHHNPQEGGPKGLDVEPRTNVLAVTAEMVPLAFFDLELALERASTAPRGDIVRLELDRLRELERSRAAAAELTAALNDVLQTKAWRMTAPAREAYGRLRGLTRRVR
jgi:hypothetical protein